MSLQESKAKQAWRWISLPHPRVPVAFIMNRGRPDSYLPPRDDVIEVQKMTLENPDSIFTPEFVQKLVAVKSIWGKLPIEELIREAFSEFLVLEHIMASFLLKLGERAQRLKFRDSEYPDEDTRRFFESGRTSRRGARNSSSLQDGLEQRREG